MTDINEIKQLLTRYGQEHVLQFWDKLSKDDRDELIHDINEINIPEIVSYFKRATESMSEVQEKLDDRMKPIPSSLYGSVSRTPPHLLNAYEQEGLKQISENRVGVLLMAGGQGTRLGSTDPKGMFNIDLPSGKTLYQIQAERIRKLQERAEKMSGKKSVITWFIMTSEHTMAPTVEFFVKHSYFGLDKNNIIFFEQGLLPCFTFDGKMILDKPHKIALAPDGNGGLYRAVKERRIIDTMEARGVKYLHCHSVDNILVRVADPVFIGYCVIKGADCAGKVVEKAFPFEPLGVVCSVDGVYQVVEYSEVTPKTAELRNNDGRLKFSAGNICNHFFTAEFLRRVIDKHENELKLHVAKKKIPYIDSEGKRNKPEKPNGIKIEKFIFDVFPFARNLVVWEVNREDEFSALKNADNTADKDTPTSARKDLFSLHRRLVEAAGGKFEHGAVICEISPLVSYAGEELQPLVAGRTFKSPLFLQSPVESSANGAHLAANGAVKTCCGCLN